LFTRLIAPRSVPYPFIDRVGRNSPIIELTLTHPPFSCRYTLTHIRAYSVSTNFMLLSKLIGNYHVQTISPLYYLKANKKPSQIANTMNLCAFISPQSTYFKVWYFGVGNSTRSVSL